ncbi:transglutaminase domain-containing protein [bacterium]|nr:transglutaminase domain-containing protein [bacterium]
MKIPYRATFFFILLASIGLAQTNLPPEENSYLLYLGDAKVGYFTYTLQPLPGGWTMQAESFMAVAVGGRPGKIRIESQWNLDQHMVPIDYKSEVYSGEELKQRTVVSVFGDTARIVIGETMRTLPLHRPFFILDSSTPDGWALLSKSLDIARDSTIHSWALLPQIAKLMPLEIQPGHIEGDNSGQSRRYLASFGGLNIEFYAKTHGKRLIYWNQKAQSIVAKWTRDLDKKEFADAEAKVDIMESGNSSRIPTGVVIETSLLKKLVVDLDVGLTPSTEPHLESSSQSFDGESVDGRLNGRASVRSIEYDGKRALEFPAGPIEEPASGTLSPSKSIQSDNAAIIETAHLLSDSASDFWDIATSVNRFVSDSIGATTRTVSAKTTLESRSGNAIAHSRLCCAILRAAGIPSRIVGGYYLEDGFWIRHHWVEAWMGSKTKWVQIDPTTGEDETFTAAHLMLWIGEGDLDPSANNSMTIVSWE